MSDLVMGAFPLAFGLYFYHLTRGGFASTDEEKQRWDDLREERPTMYEFLPVITIAVGGLTLALQLILAVID